MVGREVELFLRLALTFGFIFLEFPCWFCGMDVCVCVRRHETASPCSHFVIGLLWWPCVLW
jgi:hypothetical protein